MNRRRSLLLAQRTYGIPPLGDPPDKATAEERAAWDDIVNAVPIPSMFRFTDGVGLYMAAMNLAMWRGGHRENLRECYRCLGLCLIEMRERRRLMFPDRPRRR